MKFNEKSFNANEYELAKFRLEYNIAIISGTIGDKHRSKKFLDLLTENPSIDKLDRLKLKQIAVSYSLLAIKHFHAKDNQLHDKLTSSEKAIKYFHHLERVDASILRDNEWFLFYSILLLASIIETNQDKAKDFYNELIEKINSIEDPSKKSISSKLSKN